MTKLGLLMALLLSFGSVAHAQDGGAPEAPSCMKVTSGNARAYAILAHAMAEVVGSNGGNAAVEGQLNEEEGQAAGDSFSAFYKFGAQKSKCLALSKLQAYSMIKAIVAMGQWIESKGLGSQVIAQLTANFSKEEIQLLLHDARDTAVQMADRAGLKVRKQEDSL